MNTQQFKVSRTTADKYGLQGGPPGAGRAPKYRGQSAAADDDDVRGPGFADGARELAKNGTRRTKGCFQHGGREETRRDK